MLGRVPRELRARISFARDPVAFHRAQGVQIGDRVEIIGGSIHTFGSEPYLVRIGDDVTISNDVQFVTHDGGLRVIRNQHPDAYFYAPIEVGSRVFIGARALLLPDVTIGDGAVIAAGAVVAGDVEPDTVVAGVPARKIKTVDEYAYARQDEWIDTAGLEPGAKRDLLLSRVPKSARRRI